MVKPKAPELKFQQHIADYLVRVHGYGVLEQAEITDTEHCIAEDQLWAFLKATQGEAIKKLTDGYGTDARDEVFKALRRELDHTPLWMLLRNGLKVRGLEFRLFYPKPRSIGSAAAKKYGENRITFRPHFYFGETNLEIDFVVFLNGLPIDEKWLQVAAEELMQFEGLGDAKATLILAAIEFARRRIKPEGSKIITPADLLPHVRHYADRKQEHFLCATINGANEILNIQVISIGLIDRSHVHPREVFADAISDRAAAVIVAYNQPSGGLEPSPSGVNITARLKAAGTIVGIELLDHIIFNRTGYFSFLEAGQL